MEMKYKRVGYAVMSMNEAMESWRKMAQAETERDAVAIVYALTRSPEKQV